MAKLRCIESFKSSRDGKRVCEVIDEGGIVACAAPSGCLLLCKADNYESVRKIENWHGRKNMLCFCVPELKDAWKLWKETPEKSEISDFLSCLYLDYVITIFTAGSASEYKTNNCGAKAAVWVGQKGTINSVLRSLPCQVMGAFINFDNDAGEKNLAAAASGCDLFICSNNTFYSQEKLIIDLSSHDWRIIQRGLYSLSELKKFTKRRWILSGDLPETNKFNRLSLTNVVLCVGDEERISRRLCHFYENLRNSKEVVFFLNSECVHKALHELSASEERGDGINEVYPLFDSNRVDDKEYLQKRRHELIDKLMFYRCNDETTTIYIEAVEEEIGGDFLEKVQNCVGQILYLDGLDRWREDSSLTHT